MRSFTDIKPITFSKEENAVLYRVERKAEACLLRAVFAAAAVATVAYVIHAIAGSPYVTAIEGPFRTAAAAGCVTFFVTFLMTGATATAEDANFDRWSRDFRTRVETFNERLEVVRLWAENSGINDMPDVRYASNAAARRDELASELRALMRFHAKDAAARRKSVDLYA